MKNRYLYVTLLALLALSAEAQVQEGKSPRLVVNITIDQLRGDYLELFDDALGTEGFRKLKKNGLVYDAGYYPFKEVDRSSAISSVVTGTTPFYHSIIADKWIDRESLLPVMAAPGDIAVSTLSDELKLATKGAGKVCSVATTKEQAALAGGHTTDRIVWNDNRKKRWTHTDLTNNALQILIQEKLGYDSIPDMLYVQYEVEAQDEPDYQALDMAIAKLINEIETNVGKEHTLFVITPTGYATENTTDYSKYQIPHDTYYINRTANLLNMYMGALWGQGKYVEATYRNHIYLNHRLFESKRIALTDATLKAQEFLLQMSGVKRVDTHLYEQHAGDLVVEVSPGWQMQDDDTHENIPAKKTLAFFPIIFYGAQLPVLMVKTPVSIERIAPTIAKSIRIRAPNACMTTPLF